MTVSGTLEQAPEMRLSVNSRRYDLISENSPSAHPARESPEFRTNLFLHTHYPYSELLNSHNGGLYCRVNLV